jgi:hypothetical protein
MLIKTASREVKAPRPGKISEEIVAYFSKEQGGYFLFLIFKIATIRLATASIIINSSYVVISILPFQDSGRGTTAALLAALINTLYCQRSLPAA